MKRTNLLNIGLVGALGRASIFKDAINTSGKARVHAICDIRQDKLDQAMHEMHASEKYADYDEMLMKSDLDAVIIGTPMHLHVPQSIQALQKGLHVLSEVPAGISIDECRKLTETCKCAGKIYMIGENVNYYQSVVLVRELVRNGLFGELYYAESEYVHELKDLFEITKWRRRWQVGINGITYGTHNLGPILSWMPGDRITRVSCAGSGHHYQDPGGNFYEQEDSCVMLAKTQKGRLIKVRLDLLSNRPACLSHALQGTKGCYDGKGNRIWLADRCKDKETWMDLNQLTPEFLPDTFKQLPDSIRQSSHEGGDFLEIADFIHTIEAGRESSLGIHEAMDMTLPGLASQISIQQEGQWVEVPDSRDW